MRKFFDNKIDQLISQLRIADEKAEEWNRKFFNVAKELDQISSNQKNITKEMENVEKKKKEIEDKLNSSEENYKSQIELLSNHICTQNEKISNQEIQNEKIISEKNKQIKMLAEKLSQFEKKTSRWK